MQEPQLRAVHAAFTDAIQTANDDKEVSWHSGWLGNIVVNLGGRDSSGLCHHWQEWVYQEILPSVHEAGWEACGITINSGTGGEHHAVLVFDPLRVRREELLDALEEAPAYVLDAWRRGRPDIYTLRDWLRIPLAVRVPAELEELPDHR